MTNKRILSNKIKGLRMMKGLTQKDIAKKLKLNISTYGGKEKGDFPFNIYEALDLAKILGVSVDDIFL